MRCFLVFLGLVALGQANHPAGHHDFKTKQVDAAYIEKQKKIFSLFEYIKQENKYADYHNIGSNYDIEANRDKYTKNEAVTNFLDLYKTGFLPKNKAFSILNERIQQETRTLFYLFHNAKDFDIFYKTAAWARVHLNDQIFFSAYFTALIRRPDTYDYIYHPAYEVYPELHVTEDVLKKIAASQTDVDPLKSYSPESGVVKEGDTFVFYSNYSNANFYGNDDIKLAYYTEDIDVAGFMYIYHLFMPLWIDGDMLGPFKQRRGEIYYSTLQQLLSHYYNDRLSNGLGEIPRLNWSDLIKTGYDSKLYLEQQFSPRPNNYNIHTPENNASLLYILNHENDFLKYLDKGRFKAYGIDVDLNSWEALNFVGNYFEGNIDLYAKAKSEDHKSYESIAKQLLGAAPKTHDRYTVYPTAIESFATYTRDPVFYQLAAHILDYIYKYLNKVPKHTYQDLHFSGVTIEDVQVSEITTYFDSFDYDATSAYFLTDQQLKARAHPFKIRQETLNHNHMSISIKINSEVNVAAVVKIFYGPKYDSNGHILDIEENWKNFVVIDQLQYNITKGENQIKRRCHEMFYFIDRLYSMSDINKLLDEGLVPENLSQKYFYMPSRIMFPKGNKEGFPLQFFVVVFPFGGIDKNYNEVKSVATDNTPFLFPLDRPVLKNAFVGQSNMYFKDSLIYHKGK